MGSQETMSNPVGSEGLENEAREGEAGLASKLSQELSNWRRKRGNANQHNRETRLNLKPQSSEPARTIKVRGHETLVIRKARLTSKPRSEVTPPRA
jgi:hypothetical protein